MCVNFRSASSAEIAEILKEDVQPDLFKAKEIWPGYQAPIVLRNPDSGKIVTTVPIGIHVDATVYEPSTGLVFNANNGSVTVIHQDSPDKYSIVETVETQFKANTMALDPKTHKIYLTTAEFGPAPEATQETPKPARPMLPGTFKVLVFGR